MTAASSSPTLADWLQGWGTVGGSFFAAVAAAAALALLLHERALRRTAEADTATRQARLILMVFDEFDPPNVQRGSRIKSATLALHNFSDGIVTDIQIECSLVSNPLIKTGMQIDYIKPKEKDCLALALAGDPLLVEDTPPPDMFSTLATFTDAAGRRWYRRDRGQPKPLDASVPAHLTQWPRKA